MTKKDGEHGGREGGREEGGKGHTVVNEDARANAGRRVDVDLEELVDLTLQEEGKRIPARLPQPMGHPMCLQGLKALEVEKCVEVRATGRVAIHDRDHIQSDSLGERRFLL